MIDQLSTDELAQILWDYNNLKQPLVKSDCIMVLCSNDIRVAQYGAQLFLSDFAPFLLFSGGIGVLTEKIFHKPEAEIFADEAYRMGVPKDNILIENKSTNTGENILFSKRLLEQIGKDFRSFILVQKPYMLRRTYATFMKNWPEKKFVVSSENVSYRDYPNEIISKDLLINIMVGDTQRIKEYPKQGFQIPQKIPKSVWDAYKELVKRGYTKHLIK